MAQAHDYDAIVLDVMLPGIDGFETCRRLRGARRVVARADAHRARRRRGPRGGARQRRRRLPGQAVRVRRAARAAARARPARRRRAAGRARRSATSLLDPATREVRRGGDEIALSAKEFALLETFMRRPGEVLSRLHLLEHAWDFAYESRSNVVDVYVRRLRRKIDEPFGRRLARDGARRRLPAARTAGVSRLPIRAARHGRLRGRDGGRARRHGLVPLRAARRRTSRTQLDQELQLRAQDLARARQPARARRSRPTGAAARRARRELRAAGRRRGRRRRRDAAARPGAAAAPARAAARRARAAVRRRPSVPGWTSRRACSRRRCARRPARSCSSSARRAEPRPRRWRNFRTSC